MGDIVPSFGVANGVAKIREMGGALAIDGRQTTTSHTTTNQKQAAAVEVSMKGRRNEREAQGEHDTIVLGELRVDGF